MIKNIIFDVGDVLIEYRWLDMLMEHGLSQEEAEKIGQTMFSDSLWLELDLSILSDEEIIRRYQEKYPQYAEVIAWFITHGEYMHTKRKRIWKQVHELKKQGYHLYILSNYSENLFRKHTKGADFLKDMDGVVVSYMIHKVKPEKEIYEYLLDRYQLNPKECFFLDDRAANTKAAEDMGIHTFTVTSEQALYDRLEEIIHRPDAFMCNPQPIVS